MPKTKSSTPMAVMGGQGKPASIPQSYYECKPTGSTPFYESKRQSKPAR